MAQNLTNTLVTQTIITFRRLYIYIYLAESMGLEMFSTRAIDELGTVSGMNVVHLESGKLLLCSNRIWFPGFAGARDSPRYDFSNRYISACQN